VRIPRGRALRVRWAPGRALNGAKLPKTRFDFGLNCLSVGDYAECAQKKDPD
jgi:hypothetical protein